MYHNIATRVPYCTIYEMTLSLNTTLVVFYNYTHYSFSHMIIHYIGSSCNIIYIAMGKLTVMISDSLMITAQLVAHRCN